MGCIPSKQSVLDAGDEARAMKPRKYKKPKNLGPASPIIPEDAPPWVTGHRVVALSGHHVADPPSIDILPHPAHTTFLTRTLSAHSFVYYFLLSGRIMYSIGECNIPLCCHKRVNA
ncbi:hypothetical protein DENSPDRAFT_355678 [Dentipellis sp. KUC8613]|nr:hypothetical protein DENSPDRAFT_355678 [Dentipellis sp. KUC8613]